MKMQSDAFNYNIQNVISIFALRLSKTELREASSEIGDLRRANVDQSVEINQHQCWLKS